MSALGAYRETPAFAYPGWRLTVPGGPAGGHYKGFTHNYSAGTQVGTVGEPTDEYELTRGEGMAAHDTAHLHPNAPRGVYRGPAEVPPRPNASGSAMVYGGSQTRRHAGTSVSPGSFPADFTETSEDVLATLLSGLGIVAAGDGVYSGAPALITLGPAPHGPVTPVPPIIFRGPVVMGPDGSLQPIGPSYPNTPPLQTVPQPSTPPSVSQTAAPAPAPSVRTPVWTPSGTMPGLAPAPTVASGVVTPDGSGNFVDAFGNVYAASSVTLNPTTNQYQLVPGAQPSMLASATNWLTSHSIYSAWPNWYFLAGGGALLLLLGRGRSHGR